jgi:HPt (histidine-containing phosphotransfer) domain-containing protein
VRQFASTEADAARRIAAALAGNDQALAGRLAHTVKDVAGNIRAPAVQNATGKLEKVIKRSKSGARRLRRALPNRSRDWRPRWQGRRASTPLNFGFFLLNKGDSPRELPVSEDTLDAASSNPV